MDEQRLRKQWVRLALKIFLLYLERSRGTSASLGFGYDKIAETYDTTWTDHMQEFSVDMIDRLDVSSAKSGLDLGCGTGFVTKMLSEMIDGSVIGVDISEGMLSVARKNCDRRVSFIQSDILEYLCSQPSECFDVVTCAWVLGYSKPWKIIREISRVLRPGGWVGIIDNSLFTLSEVVYSTLFTLAEMPDALCRLIDVRFLRSRGALTRRMWLSSLRVVDSWDGTKTYYAQNGSAAITRLLQTGAAAGYEYYVRPEYYERIRTRFAQIFEERYGSDRGVPIIHRYIAAIGRK